MNRLINILFLAAGLIALSPVSSLSQYKDFVRKETKKKVYAISYDKKYVTVVDFTAIEPNTTATRRSEITISNSEIKLSPQVIFMKEGLNLNGLTHAYENLSDISITSEKGEIKIVFYEHGQTSGRPDKIREGNLVSFDEPITVNHGDFVRGMVLSIRGPITIHGEVNKDVVSLFGDVVVDTGAVARGNIASITGNLKIGEHASIYGELYSGNKDYKTRHFRFYGESGLEPGLMFNYNRVDGLLLGAKLSYANPDSLWPVLEANLGYAFASDRARWRLKVVQSLWKRKSLSIGIEYYRNLDSEDGQLLGNTENTMFALLATEDYKDYFEAEGTAIWFEMTPRKNLNIELGYRFDDTHWFGAKRHLWSLFGGGKLFRENFSSVDMAYRASGITEIDSSSNGAIFLNTAFDDGDPDKGFNSSGWNVSGELEWSNPDLNSDFDFRRYSISAIRYQYVSGISAFHLRGTFANSDGYLPMYKRYFLGGLGTMMGYKHKEFIGTRFWETNSEFWISLPIKFQPYLIAFWDVGQIANDVRLDGDSEIRHDLGLGLNVSGLRINIAKRLDGAANRDPIIYVRLAQVF